MSRSGAAPLTPWRWIGVPMLQVIVASLIFALPIRFWGHGLPEPVFAMPAVFAWAVIRPSMLAPLAVMTVGVFQDLLTNTPMGFWAVCLLLPYGVVLAGRAMLAGQSQLMTWVWYGAATAMTLGAGYLFTMLTTQNAPDLGTVGWQFLATVVLYPFADRLIDRFEDADVRFR